MMLSQRSRHKTCTGLSSCLLERWVPTLGEPEHRVQVSPDWRSGPRLPAGPTVGCGSMLIGHLLQDQTTSQCPGCPCLAHCKFILWNMCASWLEFLEARDLETLFKHSAEALKKPHQLHARGQGMETRAQHQSGPEPGRPLSRDVGQSGQTLRAEPEAERCRCAGLHGL